MTAPCRRDSDGRPLLRTDPDAKNALGQPTGFDLKATNYHKPILHPDGLSGQRAGFIYAPVWVTPKADEDHWPSGDFVNCNGPNEGLPEWVQQGRDVSKEDLVVWHSFGLHHAARKHHDHCRHLSCILLKTGATFVSLTGPEDFPVQNVVKCGFKLMPFGFFARNPVIDSTPSPAQPFRPFPTATARRPRGCADTCLCRDCAQWPSRSMSTTCPAI